LKKEHTADPDFRIPPRIGISSLPSNGWHQNNRNDPANRVTAKKGINTTPEKQIVEKRESPVKSKSYIAPAKPEFY